MGIEDFIMDSGSDVYYTKEYMQVIEDHLEYLKAHQTTERLLLLPENINRYTGNLYGYLIEIKKPLFMHWSIMRCSGMRSPTEFTFNTHTTLLIPHISALDDIRQRILMVYS